MRTPQLEAGIETALLYHEETKHHLDRYARSLGYLAWEDQPNPFREFLLPPNGMVQRVELPLAQELNLRTLGRFFELSLALSAWKEIPGHRWALRINPSSGNLHPTEAYALLPAIEGIGPSGGAYHYLSRDHALELRSGWTYPQAMKLKTAVAGLAGGFYLALTSIPWREAWKYGERAFRYCQPEIPEALVWIQTVASKRPFALPTAEPVPASPARNITPRSWLGASVRIVADMGEKSALGLPGLAGVLVLEVPADWVLARCGLQKGDVILSVDGFKAADVGTLLQQAPALADFQSMVLVISRQQKEITLNIKR